MPPRKGTPWSPARRAADTPEYRARLSSANIGNEPINKGTVNGLPVKRRKQAVSKAQDKRFQEKRPRVRPTKQP